MESKQVGILMGGLSAEREVSCASGEAIYAALKARGHDVIRWHYHLEGKSVSSGQKMARLASVGIAGAEEITISYRDIGLFFPVFVHVTKDEAKCAIVVLPPAFITRFNLLPVTISSLCQAGWTVGYQ